MTSFIDMAKAEAIHLFNNKRFASTDAAFRAVDAFRATLKLHTFTAQALLQIEDNPGDKDEAILTLMERGKGSGQAILLFTTTIEPDGFTLKFLNEA